MASMNFDHSTIANLMSLVDEHKDEFKEGEYLQLCNAMKFLHNQSQRPNGRGSTPVPPPQPVYRFTNGMAAEVISNSIRRLEHELLSNGRVTNADKLKVLRELFNAHSISEQGITRDTESHIVNQMANRVQDIVPLRTLKSMYQEAKEQRVEAKRPFLRTSIIEQEAKLAMLNRFPVEDEYRSENIRL